MRPIRGTVKKFFGDRGPHLAAMIAYFALLSFVPLVFLALALLGLAAPASASSYLVTELKRAVPGSSVSGIVRLVREVQKHAATLGIVGGIVLLWTSLSLFSVLESAFNIVYGRPNRSFLRGKGLAVVLMIGSLVTLFVGLLVGTLGFDVLKHYAPGFIGNGVVAYTLSLLISLLFVFVFLASVYYVLPTVDLTFREILPGAIGASLMLEASFQVLPVYLRLEKHVVAAQAFGGPVLLLVWLYVMANVIVFGAELNCSARRHERAMEETAAGLA
jgi:membrane protein